MQHAHVSGGLAITLMNSRAPALLEAQLLRSLDRCALRTVSSSTALVRSCRDLREERASSVRCFSGSGGVKKDVEGLDSAAFNLGDIGSGHSRGTVRRTGPPAQPSHTVMADSGTNRSENEVWWQARQ